MRCLGLTLPTGHRIETHAHQWPQLVYGVQGVIAVRARENAWVVPPMRALWVSAGTEHSLQMRGAVRLQTLYIRPDLAPKMDSPCCVIDVQPLLREVIVSIVAAGSLDKSTAGGRARFALLLDLLVASPQKPLSLPMPTDPRALRVADRIIANASAKRSFPDLVRGCGASARTIERLFHHQTGMTLGRWRQQARMLEAIQRLGDGEQVTRIATRVGYRSPSAFVAAFRSCFGRSPAQYFRAAGTIGADGGASSIDDNRTIIRPRRYDRS